MRDYFNIFTALVEYPVTDFQLRSYGVTLLFCLPLQDDDGCNRYLVALSGLAVNLRNNEQVIELLNDVLGGNGRAWAGSLAGHYYDGNK